jgi:hypothetical protein
MLSNFVTYPKVMLANVWEKDKISNRLEEIVKEFLGSFYLSEHSKPLLWHRREKFFHAIIEDVFLPEINFTFPVIYVIKILGLDILMLKDKEGNYVNISNKVADSEPWYNSEKKILEVDNSPVLVFDVADISLPKLTALNQKRELARKLKVFIFKILRDRNLSKGLFLIASSESIASLKGPIGNFSLRLLYPEGIGFNKKDFLIGKEKIIATVKEISDNKNVSQ